MLTAPQSASALGPSACCFQTSSTGVDERYSRPPSPQPRDQVRPPPGAQACAASPSWIARDTGQRFPAIGLVGLCSGCRTLCQRAARVARKMPCSRSAAVFLHPPGGGRPAAAWGASFRCELLATAHGRARRARGHLEMLGREPNPLWQGAARRIHARAGGEGEDAGGYKQESRAATSGAAKTVQGLGLGRPKAVRCRHVPASPLALPTPPPPPTR